MVCHFRKAGAIAAFVSCAPGKVMLSGADLPGHENSPRLTDLLGFERQGYAFQVAKLCFKAHVCVCVHAVLVDLCGSGLVCLLEVGSYDGGDAVVVLVPTS
jgi:hypothetical protein